MKTSKQLTLSLFGFLLGFGAHAGLVCSIEKNLDPTASGELAIKAVTTSFGDIVDNQIVLGTTISTFSGTFDLELLRLYYFHEQLNCPKFTVAKCQVNIETNILEITGEDFPKAKVEVSLALGETQVQEILSDLYPQFLNCPIK